jgi:hypothetical protein
MPAALNAKRAPMWSIPVEGLAWFAELTPAIGAPMACKAGLTPFARRENFTMTTLFDPTGFDADILDGFRNLAFSSVRK